ncbi:accessory factor associated with RNA polymerase II [Malassezia caprae]|uniref:Accessory factor associated with RNA polymerase II n=1 Tax=Malassezia caprae TaxID=1381934 RepID=A0AAF0IU45_9BASI|nr:accessory factor associated with RNA polymerase II [Malassezia caprae]
MPESDGPTDVLLCLRAAVSATPEDPLALLKIKDASGNDLDGLQGAVSVTFVSQESKAPVHTFEVHVPTRMLRNRELSSREGGPPKMESEPDAFLPLSALVFAILQRNERAGSYLRNATTAQIVPISALERAPILEYLTGKRSTWDGVTPLSDTADSEATAPSDVAATAALTKGDAERPTTSKRPFVPDPADTEFVRHLRSKYELVLLSRDDALRGSMTADADTDTSGSRAGGDLLGLRAMIAPRIEAAKKRSVASSKSSTSSSRSAPSAVNPARKSRAQDPIILLSNSPTALINMFNVKALLQDGVFIPPEEARQQAGGIPELVVTIRAPSSDEPTSGQGVSLSRRILVVDSAEAVNRLGSGAPGSDQDPWSRVICVFTTGQSWQFKSYRWSDPRDLFRNGMFWELTGAAMGVYVRWTNEAPSAQVKNWNVTHLQLGATKKTPLTTVMLQLRV